jgi:hypothetical protein
MKIRNTLLTALSILFIGQLTAQEDLTFDDWDHDDDYLIEYHEFEDEFTENYVDDWNNYDDEHLDDEDFMHATFRIFDRNDDDMLSISEWMFGYNYYYDEYLIIDDVRSYDLNNDQYISYEEYTDALNTTEYYAELDVDDDTFLNQFELANAVFNNWDVDNSHTLTKAEYERFDEFYLDI